LTVVGHDGYSTEDAITLEKLGRVKTLLLVAWVFALLALAACAGYLLTVVIIGTLSGHLLQGFIIKGLTFLAILPSTLLVLIFGVPTFLVLGHLKKMKGAAERGDVDGLKVLNSIEWAIPALVFSGIVPGIMLLLARGLIEELGRPLAPVPLPVGVERDDLDRIGKLRSLTDSGGTTKKGSLQEPLPNGQPANRDRPKVAATRERGIRPSQPRTFNNRPARDLAESNKHARETWICPKCGHEANVPAGKRRKYRCKDCGNPMSLASDLHPGVANASSIDDERGRLRPPYDSSAPAAAEGIHPNQPGMFNENSSRDLMEYDRYVKETWICSKCGHEASVPAGKRRKYRCKDCGNPMSLMSVNNPKPRGIL
jgi:putative membrane protein